MFIILQIFFATSGISQSVICQHVKVCQLASKTASFNIHDGTNKIQKVDTIIGNGTSGTEDGLISVGRVSYPTAIIAEHGTLFFVDTSSKSVRLVTRVSALIKYIRIMEDIYRAFYIHSDILGNAELPSMSEAEQRMEKAEKMLTQMLQNAKAKFKVSGVMQGPQGTPAEKTVTSVTFIKDFLHRLQTRFSEECPRLLEVTDVRTCLTLVNKNILTVKCDKQRTLPPC